MAGDTLLGFDTPSQPLLAITAVTNIHNDYRKIQQYVQDQNNQLILCHRSSLASVARPVHLSVNTELYLAAFKVHSKNPFDFHGNRSIRNRVFLGLPLQLFSAGAYSKTEFIFKYEWRTISVCTLHLTDSTESAALFVAVTLVSQSADEMSSLHYPLTSKSEGVHGTARQ